MSRNPSQSGLALVFGLIILVLVASVGAWFYLKEDVPPALNDPAVTSPMDPAAEEAQDAAPVVEDTIEVPEADSSSMPSTPDFEETGALNIERVMAVRALGNPNAPIHIIEYASMTCSHCAHFHNDVLPKLKEKYINTNKVYFEFREFPLNDPALKATITARCLPVERYDSFVSLLFKNQEKWATGIDYMSYLKQNSKLAGLSDEQFQACHDSGEIKNRIAAVMQDAQDRWKISSTPTFVINNGAQTISGAQPLENFERVFRAVSGGVVGEAPKVE
jgi:protein-disulfide isomerase